MTAIQISYYNADDSDAFLGEELSRGISVKQLPHNPDEQNIFIRKVFDGHQYDSWKVLSIKVENNSAEEELDESETSNSDASDECVEEQEDSILCTIRLSPVRYGSMSVSEKHTSNGSKLVRGRLLECDYGYFSQEISGNCNSVTTTKDFNSKLPYEMVKRRLVVVVSNKEDPALVVPISKNDKSKNKSTVVPITSLPDDLVTFKVKDCFAKAGAVSYASGHRLFPLRVQVGNKRLYDYRVEKKLSNEDVIEIKKAIFSGVGGSNILYQLDEAESTVEKLKLKVQELESQLVAKNGEVKELWETLEGATS